MQLFICFEKELTLAIFVSRFSVFDIAKTDWCNFYSALRRGWISREVFHVFFLFFYIAKSDGCNFYLLRFEKGDTLAIVFKSFPFST